MIRMALLGQNRGMLVTSKCLLSVLTVLMYTHRSSNMHQRKQESSINNLLFIVSSSC